jgi:hypothetical protein
VWVAQFAAKAVFASRSIAKAGISADLNILKVLNCGLDMSKQNSWLPVRDTNTDLSVEGGDGTVLNMSSGGYQA